MDAGEKKTSESRAGKRKDISRRNAEERKLLLDTIDTQIWYLTDEETYGAVNLAHARFLGFDPADIAYRKLRDFLPAETVRTCKEGNMEVFRTGETVRKEEWVANAAGELRLLSVTKTPKLDEGGGVEYVVCSGADITELKRAQEDLFEQRRFLENIIDTARVIILVLDTEGRIARFNPFMEEISGYGLEEVRGEDWFSLFLPSKEEVSTRELFRRAMGGRAAEGSVSPLLRKDGGLLSVEWHDHVLKDAEGRVTGLLAVGVDVTERLRAEEALKEGEERLALALRGTGAGLWDWRIPTGKMVFDERWARTLGYAPEELEPLDIATCNGLYHPDDLKTCEALLEKHFAGETEIYECECRMRHKADRWIWIVDRGKVVRRDEEGKPLRMTGTCIDISERKRLEEERFWLERRLREMRKTESLNRMAGAVAHHFNNALTAVMGNLELALDICPSGKRCESVAAALDASGQAVELSLSMLSCLGQAPSRKKPLHLAGACREALGELTGAAPENARLETDFTQNDFMVEADARQLKRVVANLFANAVEALEGRDGEIRVNVRRAEAEEVRRFRLFPLGWEPVEEAYACLEIADTGKGVSREEIGRVFDPFFSTKFTGRGLGLAVASGIVQAHRGAMAAASTPGKGSVFRVLLPLREEEVSRGKTRSGGKIGDGRTLLLAEDDANLCKMAGEMLKRQGFRVLKAADGVEAVRVLQEHREEICCAILDIVMPRMNGWEALEVMRGQRPDLPAILASGYEDASVACEDHGRQSYVFLAKPYGVSELKAALGKALTEKTAGGA